MLTEPEIRKIKSGLIHEIEDLNQEISKRHKEIEDLKKRTWITQAKLKEINKILEDQE
ncbi:hypothetical protein KKH23_06065 [Patescibacteria group bacterium]|nr:hypothetical protein [Patescibacteria group bacterium]